MKNLFLKQKDGSCCLAGCLEDNIEELQDFYKQGFKDVTTETFFEAEDGLIYLISDINSDQYKNNIKHYRDEIEISSLKQYLSDTDYVIPKLNELKLEDEAEYEAEKIKYADILKKRKEARAQINKLQGN